MPLVHVMRREEHPPVPGPERWEGAVRAQPPYQDGFRLPGCLAIILLISSANGISMERADGCAPHPWITERALDQ